MKPIYVVVFGADRIGVDSIASRMHYGLRTRKVLSRVVTDPLKLTGAKYLDLISRENPDVVIVCGHPYLGQITRGASYVNRCEFLSDALGIRLQGAAKSLTILDTGVSASGKALRRDQESWTRVLGNLDLLTPADMHLSTIKNVHIDAATYGNHARLVAAGKALDLVLWELSKTPQPAGRTNYGDAA